jgi:hypothetical protein
METFLRGQLERFLAAVDTALARPVLRSRWTKRGSKFPPQRIQPATGSLHSYWRAHKERHGIEA